MTKDEWVDKVCALAVVNKNAGRLAIALVAFGDADMEPKARRMAIATVLGLTTADVDRAFEAIAEAGLGEIIETPKARA